MLLNKSISDNDLLKAFLLEAIPSRDLDIIGQYIDEIECRANDLPENSKEPLAKGINSDYTYFNDMGDGKVYPITSTAFLEACTLQKDDFKKTEAVLDYLLQRGADINLVTKELGHTAHHAASYFGNVATTHYLFEKRGLNPLIKASETKLTPFGNTEFAYRNSEKRVEKERLTYWAADYFVYLLTHPLFLADRVGYKQLKSELEESFVGELKQEVLAQIKQHFSEIITSDSINSVMKSLDDKLLKHLSKLVSLIFKDSSLLSEIAWLEELNKITNNVATGIKQTHKTEILTEKQKTRFAKYDEILQSSREKMLVKLGYPTTLLMNLHGSFEETEDGLRFKLDNKSPLLIQDGPLGFQHGAYGVFFNNIGMPESSRITDDNCTWKLNTLKIEDELISYLGRYFGLGEDEARGYVTNGGTEGNDVALWWHHVNARTDSKSPEPLFIISDQTHYSAKKGIVDKRGAQCLTIQSDQGGAMSIDDLINQLKEKFKTGGERPIVVLATAGTTELSAFDNVVDIKKSLNTNFPTVTNSIHLDAAFSALALPVEKPYGDIAIFDYVDTLSFSGHKFLGLNTPCGVCLAKKDFYENFEKNQKVISYTGQVDATYSGSRQGQVVFMLDNTLCELDIDEGKTEKVAALVEKSNEQTKKCYNKIKAVVPARLQEKMHLSLAGNKIIIPRPEGMGVASIMQKYSVMPVGEDRIGLSIYFNVSDELMDEFVEQYAKTFVENKGQSPLVSQSVFSNLADSNDEGCRQKNSS